MSVSTPARGPSSQQTCSSHVIILMEKPSSTQPLVLLEVTLSIHAANWRLIVNKKPHRHDCCFDSQCISLVYESYKDSCEYSICCDMADILLVLATGRKGNEDLTIQHMCEWVHISDDIIASVSNVSLYNTGAWYNKIRCDTERAIKSDNYFKSLFVCDCLYLANDMKDYRSSLLIGWIDETVNYRLCLFIELLAEVGCYVLCHLFGLLNHQSTFLTIKNKANNKIL